MLRIIGDVAQRTMGSQSKSFFSAAGRKHEVLEIMAVKEWRVFLQFFTLSQPELADRRAADWRQVFDQRAESEGIDTLTCEWMQVHHGCAFQMQDNKRHIAHSLQL